MVDAHHPNWRKHDGEKMPVNGRSVVDARHRNGRLSRGVVAITIDWPWWRREKFASLKSLDVLEYREVSA